MCTIAVAYLIPPILRVFVLGNRFIFLLGIMPSGSVASVIPTEEALRRVEESWS